MKLNVSLGERSYPIYIEPGAISGGLVPRLREVARFARLYAVTDENVAAHYAGCLEGIDVTVLPAGEATKSFAHYQALCGALLGKGVDRNTVLVALGGGVVGDLVGFVAATLLRGISFVQLPTTLLAQVDSSVGGKTGIDTPQGKNLVGAFHQPECVIIDPLTLKTLPQRHMRAGYAEVVKYGLIRDVLFFDWLEESGRGVVNGDVEKQIHAIAVSCQAKADVVAGDEKELGLRALLNLGHTFAHAVELLNGYDESILHGEAVAAGICLAYRLSHALGRCSDQDVARVEAHFAEIGLPTRLVDFEGLPGTSAPYLDAMMADKKARDNRLVFVVPKGIGDAFVADDLPADMVAGADRR